MRSSLPGGRVSGLPLIRVIAAGLAGEKVISHRRQHLAKRPALRHDHDWNRAVAGEADRHRADDAMAGTGGAADHDDHGVIGVSVSECGGSRDFVEVGFHLSEGIGRHHVHAGQVRTVVPAHHVEACGGTRIGGRLVARRFLSVQGR
jgi:hypothetical protein